MFLLNSGLAAARKGALWAVNARTGRRLGSPPARTGSLQPPPAVGALASQKCVVCGEAAHRGGHAAAGTLPRPGSCTLSVRKLPFCARAPLPFSQERRGRGSGGRHSLSSVDGLPPPGRGRESPTPRGPGDAFCPPCRRKSAGSPLAPRSPALTLHAGVSGRLVAAHPARRRRGGGARGVPLRGIVGRRDAAGASPGAGRGGKQGGREAAGKQPGRAGPAPSLPPPPRHGKWSGAGREQPPPAPPQPPSVPHSPGCRGRADGGAPLDGRVFRARRPEAGRSGAELPRFPVEPRGPGSSARGLAGGRPSAGPARTLLSPEPKANNVWSLPGKAKSPPRWAQTWNRSAVAFAVWIPLSRCAWGEGRSQNSAPAARLCPWPWKNLNFGLFVF